MSSLQSSVYHGLYVRVGAHPVCVTKNLPTAIPVNICTNHKILWASIFRIITNVYAQRIPCCFESEFIRGRSSFFVPRSMFPARPVKWKLVFVGFSLSRRVAVCRIIALPPPSWCIWFKLQTLCACCFTHPSSRFPWMFGIYNVSKQMNISIITILCYRIHAAITRRTTSHRKYFAC